MKTTVFPGSFDPWHEGHDKIVEIGLENFDKVLILVANNPTKNHKENPKERFDFIRAKFMDDKKVVVYQLEHNKTTPDFLKEMKTNNIIRGYRDEKDMMYEANLRRQYQKENKDINYFLVETGVKTSSTIVRSDRKIEELGKNTLEIQEDREEY